MQSNQISDTAITVLFTVGAISAALVIAVVILILIIMKLKLGKVPQCGNHIPHYIYLL